MPAQCPTCARFLAKAFVEGLEVEPAVCPKCETLLTAEQFGGEPAPPQAPTGRDEEPAAAAELRNEVTDELAGWDTGADVVDLDHHRGHDAPSDLAIVAGAGAFGLVAGAVVSARRGRGGVLGLLAGVLAAAVARRIWVLEDQG